jgi:ubiquinone/menaquinone biosynthesis C-methylase UbiE
MSEKNAGFVGSIPDHYDRMMGPVLFVDCADDIARRAAASAPERVLEVAAGTGIVTRRLRDRLPATAHLTATDLNPPMLEVARAKFRPGEQVEFQPADATALPFGDATFDAVVCQFGIMFYPDKEKSYREVHRVLAPQGRYLFNVWDSHRHNPYARIMHETVTNLFPTDPPQFYTVPYSCDRIDPIKETLVDAKFADIKVAVLSWEKELPDVAAFVRGFVYGAPIIDQIRARDAAAPDRIAEAATESLKREFGTHPTRIPLQAIVFEARKR